MLLSNNVLFYFLGIIVGYFYFKYEDKILNFERKIFVFIKSKVKRKK